MLNTEQTMQLKCRDCSWSNECEVLNAKECVAEHINDWTEKDGYPNLGHTVEGHVITIFQSGS